MMLRTRARMRRIDSGTPSSYTADQRGIAMLTVLFIGAALTVAATTASFMAIRNLRSQQSDVRGAQAVSYAEAGLQRYLNTLKLGSFGIGTIMTAGCLTAPVTIPPGTIGGGTYNAQLTVYNASTTPQVPPSPWSSANVSSPPCQNRSPYPTTTQLYAISSTGTSGTGTRVIRAVVAITGSGLPTGVFVRTMNVNGNPTFNNMSVFANGDIFGREKMAFTGTDAQYTLADVYCSAGKIVNTTTACPANYSATHIPSAVHATGAIYATLNSRKGSEHPPSPNCSANPRGTAGESLWDGSGQGTSVTATCTGWSTFAVPFPPTALFSVADMNRITARSTLPQLSEAEYSSLKASAQASGLYCSITTAGVATCTKQGAAFTMSNQTINQADVDPLTNYVAYFEYAPGNNPLNQSIKWNPSATPCSNTPALNHSAVVVVRNGGVTLRSNGSMYGAIVAPDGIVDAAGGYTLFGSVIAAQMQIRGNASFQIDTCASQNLASPLINVSSAHWTEIDR